MATPHVAIRDVWAHNVEREFAIVRSVVEKFPYIAMARARRTAVASPGGCCDLRRAKCSAWASMATEQNH